VYPGAVAEVQAAARAGRPPLDLQAAFSRAYDLGGLASQIDYKRQPPLDVPVLGTHRSRIDLLRQFKMR
jgi:hypothetical protein